MDPITGLPPATAPGGADPATPATPAAQGDATVTDAQVEEFRSVAAGFVSQMYMTLWRESQRNSGSEA